MLQLAKGRCTSRKGIEEASPSSAHPSVKNGRSEEDKDCRRNADDDTDAQTEVGVPGDDADAEADGAAEGELFNRLSRK